MVGRLTQRVEVLEQKGVGRLLGPAVWLVAEPGEAEAEARTRHEATEGPIGNRFVILWRPMLPPAKEIATCN